MTKTYRQMAKNARGKIREISSSNTIAVELPLPLAEIISSTSEELERFIHEAGLSIMYEMMRSECERIAGEKSKHQKNREYNWWGDQSGYVYFAGQKVSMKHPRIRGKHGEVRLKTYEAFQRPEKMKESVYNKILRGISTRDYEEVIETIRKNYGVKKSSISRHFVQATSLQLEKFLERQLADMDILVILLDGIQFKGEHFRDRYTGKEAYLGISSRFE